MKQCLIVDDSRIIRQVARRILEDLAFEAEEAQDSEGALMSCRRRMPDTAGFLRARRREPSGDVPYVLLCLTENDVRHITAAIEAGADEYILKPFDRALIMEKVKEAGLATDI